MLNVRGLTKRYGDLVANDDVSFTVGPGQMVGFVGPNGAGKSTTMRSVMGLVEPDAGTVTWTDATGARPVDAEVLTRVGYLPEQRGLYAKMGIAEQVAYFARLKGVPKAEADRRAADLLGDLGLGDRLGDSLEKLSHGNQQRVQLAVALVPEPELLILDEPFNGLDPVAAGTLQAVLAERVRAGTGVLFSSHQLELVERTCDHVVVIAGGRVRAAGAVDEVRARRGDRSVTIRVDRPLVPLADTLEGSGLEVLDGSTRSVRIAAPDDAVIDAALARIREAGPIAELHYQLPSLTDLFAHLVEESTTEEVPA